MKPIIAFLSFCLLFSPLVSAAAKANIAETYIPETSAIHEAPETVEQSANPGVNPNSAKPGAPAAPSAPETTAIPTPGVTTVSEANTVTEINRISDYQLAPGDNLEISVWKEDGLQQQQYLISPDGTIIFPLIGTVIAAGKTITELKDYLVTRLADYISEPSITVKLMNNQGNSIFVIGKVNKPGQYFSARKIDVLQALSLAGGLTVYADEDSITIQRRSGNTVKVFPFDYSDVIKGDDLEQNILLEPGDTVTVP